MRLIVSKISLLIAIPCLAVACCALPIVALAAPPWIGALPARVTAPIAFTQTLTPLAERDTMTQLAELAQWGTGADSGAVTALALGDSTLRALYETDHTLRNWTLDDGTLISTYDVEWAGYTYTQFDPIGARVVTTAEQPKGTEEIPAVNLWYTTTGAKIKTFDFHSFDVWGTDANRHVFIPGTQIVLAYSDNMIDIIYLAPLTSDAGYPVLSGSSVITNTADGWRGKVGRMAADPQGDFVALAFQEGLMRIYTANTFEPASKWNIGGLVLDATYFDFGLAENYQQPVHDLQFDPTRRWLAQIWGSELRVWEIGYPEPTLYLTATTSKANVLTFDRTGQFLFVGTEKSVQVWEVETKTLLQEYPVEQSVTAILVSPDNRLLIYGDTVGVIHLLGKTAVSTGR